MVHIQPLTTTVGVAATVNAHENPRVVSVSRAPAILALPAKLTVAPTHAGLCIVD